MTAQELVQRIKDGESELDQLRQKFIDQHALESDITQEHLDEIVKGDHRRVYDFSIADYCRVIQEFETERKGNVKKFGFSARLMPMLYIKEEELTDEIRTLFPYAIQQPIFIPEGISR